MDLAGTHTSSLSAKILLLLLCLELGIPGIPIQSFGQSYFSEQLENWQVKPVVMLQFWGVYSHGNEVFNEDTGIYEPVEARLGAMIRRGRLGLRAKPYQRLGITVMGHFDLVGRDVLLSTVGGTNPATPDVGLWDAFFQWQVRDSSESLYLVGGFFRPQFSREAITSGWSVNSQEKSMSQNYIRRHLVGTGPGRATGLNVGGLLKSKGLLGLQYNLGIFFPLHTAEPNSSLTGISIGRQSDALLVGRIVGYVGDPEQKRYKIGYDINYYNQRRGLSVGLNGAVSGATDLFSGATALGADVLFNYDNLNVDGELIFMRRSGSRNAVSGMRDFAYASRTGHLRTGVNLIINERYFIEPVAMIMFFDGGDTETEQADAKAVKAFAGSEKTYDVGLNWYLNKKHLKLSLHYTWREGNPGVAGAGATVNQYFSQSGVGAIRRGDWLGLGLNVIL